MHIYFSGIGGAGIGPLALIAYQAGFKVSGSDKISNHTINYLHKHGLQDIHIGQNREQIAAIHKKQPIDWFVYTSAIQKEQKKSPELVFCAENGIKTSLRNDFLNYLLKQKSLEMIAIAGTHGKTTTTAMSVWLFKQLGMPISYSVGAEMSFAGMGAYETDSKYFIYEADEYDRNFLSFSPRLSLITGIDWDHPDIYPTAEEYNAAFRQFLDQSSQTIIWQDDAGRLNVNETDKIHIIEESDEEINTRLKLPGAVNRLDAWLVAKGVSSLTGHPLEELLAYLNDFPGVSRRFEKIAPNIYSDYAHTPPKIRGALQLAKEIAGKNVVVVYEGLHNTRQHFIKDELLHLFDNVKQLYVVPSFLAREDPALALLTPKDLISLLSHKAQKHSKPASLDETLRQAIQKHASAGDLVLCLSAGGAKSLDEWLRSNLQKGSSKKGDQ